MRRHRKQSFQFISCWVLPRVVHVEHNNLLLFDSIIYSVLLSRKYTSHVLDGYRLYSNVRMLLQNVKLLLKALCKFLSNRKPNSFSR